MVAKGEFCWIAGAARTALRAEPDHRSEQVSELLWGEPQQILEEHRGWAYVRGWLDGYAGWVPSGVLLPAWREGEGWQIVGVRQAPLYRNGRPVGWVSVGSLWPKTGFWRTAAGDYTTLPEALWPGEGRKLPLGRLRRIFQGTPYHWGGKSPAGVDCSGLVQVAYRFRGVFLPRDAYQQVEVLSPTDSPGPGDLVFFTAAKEKAPSRIVHVGLYLGAGHIFHATPSGGVHGVPLSALFTHRIHSYRTPGEGNFVI